jgi:iron complex outermembrane receptor protein
MPNNWRLKRSAFIPLAAIPFAIAPMMAQAQETAADADAADEETTETVIVTGTRASGVDAFSSSSPIQVLSAESIESAGRPDLMNALSKVVQSF